MSENKLMDQINAIFSVFMVVFYIGVGILLLFFLKTFELVKPMRVILGGTFIFYGVYRAFRTYAQIVDVFFSDKKDQE